MTFQPRIFAHLQGRSQIKLVKQGGAQRSNPVKSEGVPYRLQVVAELPRSGLPSFHKRSRELVAIITDAGLSLELSCWNVVDDTVYYYNYWNLKEDANQLFNTELILPDNPRYLRFAELWLSERKDIVIPINKNRELFPTRKPSIRYVYLRSSFNIRFGQLSEFDARVEANLVPFARQNGWFLGDCYYGMTGRAGDIVQIWAVPEQSAHFASQHLSTAPWHSLIQRPPVFQVLEPTPSDPLLGSQTWTTSPASKAAGG